MNEVNIYKVEKDISHEKIYEIVDTFTYIFEMETITNYTFNFNNNKANKTMINLNLLKIRHYLDTEQILIVAEKKGKVIGVAVILRNNKISLSEKIRTYFPAILKLLIPLIKIIKFKRAIEVHKLLPFKEQPAKNYYSLEAIGVKPEYQGQGIGKILLEKIDEMAINDADCQGIYLYTADPKNQSIYSHLGYQTLEEKSSSNLSIYHMFKKLLH